MTTSPATAAQRTTTRSMRLALGALAGLIAILGLVAAPTPASATPCPAAVAPFADIPTDHPFCREILQGQTEGWSTGYADGTFRPLNQMTRQSAAVMLWQVANAYDDFPSPLVPCAADVYPDVPKDHPFCPHIRNATMAGVFKGYADGTFGPTQPITRQSAAAILYRFPQWPWAVIGCEPPLFTDVPAANPFCEEVNALSAFGIINGYADGTFRPTQVVNRQHFVTMLSRYTDYL